MSRKNNATKNATLYLAAADHAREKQWVDQCIAWRLSHPETSCRMSAGRAS